MKSILTLTLIACLSFMGTATTQAADPWADNVVQYTPGAGISNDFVTGTPFDNPAVALGAPTRFTSDVDNFGGATTPLQSAFRNDEIVSIGTGGSLTVSFDEPVTDDPNNPFGIDLLIFGNSFLFGSTIFNDDFSFNPAGTVDGVASEGGVIELSDDGLDFVAVTGIDADGLFPTYSYSDLVDPFPTTAGSIPTNFAKPVDPAFDIVGNTFAEIIAAYDGSGGGAGIDIGAYGLDLVTHVRVSNPSGSASVPEIDAFADVAAVPEPTTVGLVGIAGLAAFATRRR